MSVARKAELAKVIRAVLQEATFKLRMDARKNQPCQELMRKCSQVKGVASSRR